MQLLAEQCLAALCNYLGKEVKIYHYNAVSRVILNERVALQRCLTDVCWGGRPGLVRAPHSTPGVGPLQALPRAEGLRRCTEPSTWGVKLQTGVTA